MCGLLQSYPKYIRLKGGIIVVNKKWIAEQKRLKLLRERRDQERHERLKKLKQQKGICEVIEEESVETLLDQLVDKYAQKIYELNPYGENDCPPSCETEWAPWRKLRDKNKEKYKNLVKEIFKVGENGN
jgi:hypothetical protein